MPYASAHEAERQQIESFVECWKQDFGEVLTADQARLRQYACSSSSPPLARWSARLSSPAKRHQTMNTSSIAVNPLMLRSGQVLSIESQLSEASRLVAGTQGLEVVRIYEEAQSARPSQVAPCSTRCSAIGKDTPDGIISWHPDRLARNAVDGGSSHPSA